MKSLCLAAVLLMLGSTTSLAKLGGAESVATPAPQEAAPPAASMDEPGERHFSFMVGPSFIVGAESMGALGLSARYHRERLAVELGGQWPATVSTDFKRVQKTLGGVAYDARIDSLAEIHLAAHYDIPRGQQDLIAPEVGLGVSLLRIQNEIRASTPTGFSRSKTSETSWSPLARLGLRFFPKSRISFLLDLAYVYYPNKPRHAGAEFSLPVEGLMIRPMVTVRF